MNEDTIFFSIIIPVLNTDLVLLEKCLLSIQKQSFSSFEVILIDGGSNIPVVEFLKMFISKDEHFKLFLSEKGVSKQRNLGIKKAVGKYVLFVDSDDYISNDFLIETYNICKKREPDIAVPNINCTKLINGKFEVVYSYNQYKEQFSLVTADNFFAKIKEHGLAFVFRAYKKTLFDNCLFDPDLSFGEDMLFNFSLSEKHSLKLSKVENATYFYNRPINKNLLTNRINESTLLYFDKLINLIDVYKRNSENKNGLIYQYKYAFKAFYYECLKFNRKKMIRKIFKYRMFYLRVDFSLRNIIYVFFPSLYRKIKKYN